MNLKSITFIAALVITAATLWADDAPRRPLANGQPQQREPGQPGGPRPPRGDPMGDAMFPPDLVMRAAQDIGLTDEQRTSIEQEMQAAQGGFEQMHKNLQGEMQALVAIMKQPKVDEAQAQSQFDKVLAAENEIKKAQIALTIHIKNRLTPEQQTKLTEMKRNMLQPGGSRRPQPPGPDGFGPDGGPPPGGDRHAPQRGPDGFAPDGGSRRRPPPDAPPPPPEEK